MLFRPGPNSLSGKKKNRRAEPPMKERRAQRQREGPIIRGMRSGRIPLPGDVLRKKWRRVTKNWPVYHTTPWPAGFAPREKRGAGSTCCWSGMHEALGAAGRALEDADPLGAFIRVLNTGEFLQLQPDVRDGGGRPPAGRARPKETGASAPGSANFLGVLPVCRKAALRPDLTSSARTTSSVAVVWSTGRVVGAALLAQGASAC